MMKTEKITIKNCINQLFYAKITKEEKNLEKDLLNIEVIKEYIAKRKIDWTKHCLNRLNQRNILIYKTNNEMLHVVCGINEDTVHMITAYYPNTEKWEEDMKTRREK